jgi:hypothetical protein
MSDDKPPSAPDAATGAPDAATGEPDAAPGEPDAASGETDAAAKTERVDEDGLPLDREATIDDVRSRTGQHGRFALGCAVLVIVLIAAFWAIRSGLGG